MTLNDGWDLAEGSTYSRNTWYPGTGSSGNSVAKTVRYPMWVLRMVQELIQSGKLPLKTDADFFRDAAVHSLHYIKENMDALEIGANSALAFIRSHSKWTDDQAIAEEFNELITKMLDAARNLRNIGHDEIARQKALELYRDISNVDDPIWQSHFARRIEESFPISRDDLLEL